jgi:predicted ribosome quality control (RQC) complex YloA/Tae2 family protein
MDFAISNLALKHLVEEMQFFVNGFVNKVQTSENGLLKMKIHTKAGDKTIIITKNAFFLSQKSVPAKQNPGGFSAFLKKFLFNQRIISIKQQGLDRIVLLEFPDVILVLELFAKGNIILLDRENKILKAMRKEKWKDRTLAIGETYVFPSSKGVNPLDAKEKTFVDELKTNKKTFFGGVVELLNVSPGIVEFVFEKNKLDKQMVASKVSTKDAKTALKELQKIYSKKSKEAFVSNKVIYSVDIGKEKEMVFASVGDAIYNLEESKEEKVIKPKKKKTKEIDWNKETKKCEQQEIEFKEKGEYVYLKYNKIKEILDAVKKGEAKGLAEKEIIKKINSVQPVIKELNFKDKKIKLNI